MTKIATFYQPLCPVPVLLVLILLAMTTSPAQIGPDPYQESDYGGFESIFDGTLQKWDGDFSLWRVQGNTIIGQTHPGQPVPANTFLIWRGGTVEDFDLKIDFRMSSTNSGLQYRSIELPKEGRWVLKGYQADFDFNNEYTGALYEERGPRGLITKPGDMVQIPKNQRPRIIGQLRNASEIKKNIRANDWNNMHVIARANVLIHLINGYVTSVVVDDDIPNRRDKGLIGLQIHTGDPMKVEFRNLYLRNY